jgi:predicted transcriptional regulator
MAKKHWNVLTDLELRLMNIVWDKGKVTVRNVKDALPKSKPLAYSTVLTVMRNLEWKGYVRHEVQGRTYIYEPVVARDEVVQSMLGNLANRLFGGSSELLMVNFLEKEKLSLEKLKRLKELIAEKEKELKK